jgi:hypothetical protein
VAVNFIFTDGGNSVRSSHRGPGPGLLKMSLAKRCPDAQLPDGGKLLGPLTAVQRGGAGVGVADTRQPQLASGSR